MPPEQIILLGDSGARWGKIVKVSTGCAEHAVAVARNRRVGSPAGCGIQIVAGQGFIAILVGVHGCGDAVKVVDHVLDLGLGDHFLAFQDTAQEEAYDYQHNGDLDQGKAGLSCSHSISPHGESWWWNDSSNIHARFSVRYSTLYGRRHPGFVRIQTDMSIF